MAHTELHRDRALQAFLAEVTGPLHDHLLPCLTGQALLALRSSCRNWRAAVDGAPLSAVQQQCEALLPSELHGTAAGSPHLYSMVLAQAAVLAAVRNASRVTLHRIPTDGQIAEAALWEPVWPLRCLALVMVRVPRIWAELMDTKELIVVSLPSSSPAMYPKSHAAIILRRLQLANLSSWAAWCRGGAYLTFEEKNEDGQQPHFVQIAVLDVRAGSLARVPSHLHTVGNYPSTQDWVSPACDALLVPQPGQTAAVLIYSLPSLHLVSKLPGPGRGIDSPCSVDEELSKDWHKMAIYELNWSPTGAQAAILWDSKWSSEIATPELHIFSLNDLHNVRLMRQAVPQYDDDAYVWRCSWSPSGSWLLMSSPEAAEDGGDDVKLVSPSGDCQTVILPEDTNSAIIISWSACGQYLSGVDEERSSEDASVTATRGFIWDPTARQTCFTWRADGKDRVSWSHKGSKCVMPSCGVILTLPTSSHRGPCSPILKLLARLTACPTWSTDAAASSSSLQRSGTTDADRLSLSPCGDLLVGCWQMQRRLGSFKCSGRLPEIDSGTRQRPWQLWHGKCRGTSDALGDVCSMQSVAAGDAQFSMTSIAFHPHPSCHRIYAIADTDGSVHLRDSYGHSRLRLWTWPQLSQQLEEASTKQEMQLKWSWDGAQLAVLATGLVVLIAFEAGL